MSDLDLLLEELAVGGVDVDNVTEYLRGALAARVRFRKLAVVGLSALVVVAGLASLVLGSFDPDEVVADSTYSNSRLDGRNTTSSTTAAPTSAPTASSLPSTTLTTIPMPKQPVLPAPTTPPLPVPPSSAPIPVASTTAPVPSTTLPAPRLTGTLDVLTPHVSTGQVVHLRLRWRATALPAGAKPAAEFAFGDPVLKGVTEPLGAESCDARVMPESNGTTDAFTRFSAAGHYEITATVRSCGLTATVRAVLDVGEAMLDGQPARAVIARVDPGLDPESGTWFYQPDLAPQLRLGPRDPSVRLRHGPEALPATVLVLPADSRGLITFQSTRGCTLSARVEPQQSEATLSGTCP